MLGAVTAIAVSAGSAWVTKLLNKQPKDVSPYFSRNGEYLAAVTRDIASMQTTFAKYASQLPENSPEAKEYLAICAPALNWHGERNAIPAKKYELDIIPNEGQRLVEQYQKKSLIGKAGDSLSAAIVDPIETFFSWFSTNKDKPAQDYLGVPKTDTLIPIVIEPQAPAEKKTTFEKFALPVGIAVASGVVLLMLRR